MPSKHELREMASDEVRRLLVGPMSGDEEEIEGRLTLRYFSGILFPKNSTRSQLAKESEEFEDDSGELDASDNSRGQEFSGDEDNPLSMANEELPSSVGLTFVVPNESMVTCDISGARYEKMDSNEQRWKRIPIEPDNIAFGNDAENLTKVVLDERAEFRIFQRPSRFDSALRIVTVSLINRLEAAENKEGGALSRENKKNVESRLYQVGIRCSCPKEKIHPYRSFNAKEMSLDEQILELQNAGALTFAVGHGTACSWSAAQQDKVESVWINYMPSAYTFRPLFDNVYVDEETLEPDVFDMKRLADPSSAKDSVIESLGKLCDFYGRWIDECQKSKPDNGLEVAKSTLISGMEECLLRMRRGVELLASSNECWRDFQLANLALLLQRAQLHSVNVERTARLDSNREWPIPHDDEFLPEPNNGEFPKDIEASWRPFQLAFGLMILPDLESNVGDEEGHFRNVADLIWFSTGGGKTEAYLLVTAYELIRRRTRYDGINATGTAVITRYTLRFLTADQFSRTAALCCALEKVRISNDFLGDTPFDVGLYIGQASSYRDIRDANETLETLRSSPDAKHKFALTVCPNCGTCLLPSETQFDDGGQVSGDGFGILNEGGKIVYRCNNRQCLFSAPNQIPIVSVDEQIYEHPPCIVLGTVDKFANLAFSEKAGSLFGRRSRNQHVLPPSLIIQDELHLISGPLGTIVAIYEASMDQLIKMGRKRLGLDGGAKYIASSATVRDAERQIRHLTARKTAIFPPRGVSSDDSFFSREDDSMENARKYVGIMGQGLRSTSAAHWSSSAILQAVRSMKAHVASISELDFLWTLLVYCNSKKELGLINSAVQGEILDRMKVYAEYQGLNPDDVEDMSKLEVSSEQVKDIVSTRADLMKPVTAGGSSSAFDVVPCTNMISVGIDIDRLGLMLINGQPKTTSEYIQASSRVGRDPINRGPGLVFCLYSPAKPRDRSHYENFTSFHAAPHRLVEPTSVTPGSEQALKRALHASIVIAVRHSIEQMRTNAGAHSFDPTEPETSVVLEGLRSRLLRCYSDEEGRSLEQGQIQNQFDEVVSQWYERAQQAPALPYYSSSKNHPSLLVDFNTARSGFETMRSMRGVDIEIPMRLKP